MKKYLTRWHFLFLILFVVGSIFASYGFGSEPSDAEAATGCDNDYYNVSGYAWGSNLGWIEFKGVSQSDDCYGVHFTQNINDNGGKFSLYAWGSNTGWIRLEPKITNTGPDALPTGATDAHGVELVKDTGRISGWARACSVFKSNTCEGDLRDDSARGGWDGWIKMSGDWDGDGVMEPGATPISGPTSDNYVQKTGNELDGFAWGSDVVGWLDFCTDTAKAANKCVKLNTLDVSCTTNPATEALKDTDVEWIASVYPATPPSGTYTYSWEWTDGYTPQSGSSASVSRPHNTTGQPITGTVRVTDTANNFGEGSCSINIENQNQKTLTVVIVDDVGTATYSSVSIGLPVSESCSDGNCPYLIDVTSGAPTIDLTKVVGAGAPANIVFSNWSVDGDPSTTCTGSVSPCAVTMNDHVTVYAYFDDINTNSSVTLGNPDPPVIRISAQNTGSAAESNKSTLTVNNTGASDIKVCINKIISKENNKAIETIVDEAEALFKENYDYPSCIIYDGDTTVTSNSSVGCRAPQSCVNVSAGATKQIQVSVKVYDKIYEILRDSPFKVEVEAKQNNNQSFTPSQIKEVEFRYQVPDIRPR